MNPVPHGDIHEGVAELLAQIIEVSPAEVTRGARLVEDLGVDSLSMVELMTGIEARFGVVIPDAEVTALQRVEDVVVHVAGDAI